MSLVKSVSNYIIRERSDYQLKHFVIEQHDTPEMRFRQIIIEAKDMLYKIKQTEISLEISKRQIEKLEASSNEIDHLKAKRKRLDMAITLDVLEGAKQELNYLVELSKDYRHYTSEEIEANQSDYWQKRLTRQANTDRMALEQGINVGNLESMMKAGLIQKELAQ
jgi:hypothetical protein